MKEGLKISGKFLSIFYEKGIFRTLTQIISTSGRRRKIKFQDINKVMVNLGFYFTEKVFKYGINQGYFPPGNQKAEGKTRYYSIEDLYIFTSVMILKIAAPSKFKLIVKNFNLKCPNNSRWFLRYLDKSRNHETVTSLEDISSKTEALARGIHYLFSNKINPLEFNDFLDSLNNGEHMKGDDHNLILVEEYLTDLGSKIEALFQAEKKRIIDELRTMTKE